MKPHFSLVGSALAVSLQPAGASPCALRQIQAQGDDLRFGIYKIHLEGSSDSLDNPPNWQGPADVTRPNGESCSVEIAIISSPFFGAGDHILYSSAYNGSEVNISAIDLRNCNVPWFSPNYTGAARITHGDSFTYLDAPPTFIGPNCLRPGVKP